MYPQKEVTCPKCGGTGQNELGPGKYHGMCDTCDGRGHVIEYTWPEADGTVGTATIKIKEV